MKKPKKKKSKKSRRPSRSSRKVLARLSPADLKRVNDGQSRIDEKVAVVKMLADGQRFLWAQLHKKYSVVKDYDFDPKTGEILQKQDG